MLLCWGIFSSFLRTFFFISIELRRQTLRPQPQKPKSLKSSSENPNQQSIDPSLIHEENEEQGECGFCLFMKGAECRETFINREKCVEEGKKNDEDIVDKCFDVTSALKKCMEAHPDYHGVILQAEKEVEEEARNQLDQEQEQKES